MKCELRAIKKEDETFLFEVYVSTRRQEVESWGWSPQQIHTFLSMQWQTQQHSYRQQFPNANHYLILYENDYAGRCIIEDLPRHLHLIDLSILPGFQGKRIGTFIIELLQQKASKKEKPLMLQVFHENSAMLLYEKLGFRVVEDHGLYVRMQWQKI